MKPYHVQDLTRLACLVCSIDWEEKGGRETSSGQMILKCFLIYQNSLFDCKGTTFLCSIWTKVSNYHLQSFSKLAFLDSRAHASLTEKEEMISSQRREKRTPFKDHSPLA